MTPQIDCLGKMSTVVRVSTHIYGVSKEIDGKMFIFRFKPRHVTPQIDRLRKKSPVLRVSTHIYGVLKDIGGKTFIRSFVCNTKKTFCEAKHQRQVSSNFQIYLGKTDDPPSIKLDNFTDLIFRFSGLPAHTTNWPPTPTPGSESISISTLCLQRNIKRPIVNSYK